VTLQQAIETLILLKSQFQDRGFPDVDYEELCMDKDALRLRYNGKVLRIPLVEEARR
jgi:hypothetical protein